MEIILFTSCYHISAFHGYCISESVTPVCRSNGKINIQAGAWWILNCGK